MKLSGQQQLKFTDALLDAFPNQASLAQMVRFRLDINLNAIAMGSSLRDIVFNLIEKAEADGWTTSLICAARESNPGNPILLAFSQQFGFASTPKRRHEIERLIRESNSYLDVTKWRTRLGEVEAQVCRIEINSNGGTIYGTGFLIGPDIVMTNHHVVEAVIAGEQGRTDSRGYKARASNVILRFDYKKLSDGTTINSGTVFGLAEKEWLIDQSPNSSLERMPRYDELDYALLRVDDAPGNHAIAVEKAEPSAPTRGWIEIPQQPYDFDPHTSLYIMQHPQGAPLKLVIDTDAIIGMNENRTRVTYKTNTEPGSSGSPSFNKDWELVSLHHSGDPNFDPDHKPEYNEGIPISAIMALLDQHGLMGVLG